MALRLGKCSKDSMYLKRIKAAIEGDKDHPRNNGVQMQAHHVISATGMKLSGLADKIEDYGYDINLLANLAFIPCTLQGACYLGVQPHRGNHDAAIDQDDYEDDMEPKNYHDMVQRALQALDLPLAKDCPGDDLSKTDKVVDELNRLSRKILNLIQSKPKAAPLTKVALHFGKNASGCGGVDSVTKHQVTTPCPVERHHLYDKSAPEKSQGSGQKVEKILFRDPQKFSLKVGR